MKKRREKTKEIAGWEWKSYEKLERFETWSQFFLQENQAKKEWISTLKSKLIFFHIEECFFKLKKKLKKEGKKKIQQNFLINSTDSAQNKSKIKFIF
jgi:hypothetical protein